MKLLMHTCCAPCSVYCIESLRNEGIEPTLYWYNPNIHPYKEYEARRDCLKEYAKSINVEAIFEDEYGLDEFCKNVTNSLESRCIDYCYPIRLRKTFEYAKQNGYDTVTTTLLYSIYQNHNFLKTYCEELSKEYEIEFLYRDFRHGFWEGHDKAKQAGLYMQKYCGCIFSEEESATNNSKKPEIQLPQGFEWQEKKRFEIRSLRHITADIFNVPMETIDNTSICYILKYGDEVLSIALLEEINKNTIELKYIETISEKRNKGYATRLIKSLAGNYKQKYKEMIIGSNLDTIPFFVKNGFDEFIQTKEEKNYYKKKLN